MTFRTPVGKALTKQCGLVHLIDFRVGRATASARAGFPKNCAPGSATPQERAFEFHFFDTPSCISTDDPPITPP